MTALLYTQQATSESLYIAESAPTTNTGTNTSLFVGESDVNQRRRSLVRHPSLPDKVKSVETPILSLFSVGEALNADRTVSVYRCKRNWVEAQATWNIYSTGNNWGTAGAMGAADYDSTLLGSATVSQTIAANAELQIPLDASLFLAYLNDQITYPGGLLVVMTEITTNLWNIHSNDSATSGYRPKLSFYYGIGNATRTTFVGL
jgi:hypothetical protein